MNIEESNKNLELLVTMNNIDSVLEDSVEKHNMVEK
jgi:hypothetical protein